MDIVSDLPFKLQLIINFPNKTIQNATKFYVNEQQIWQENIMTLTAEENDEIEVLFNSDDEGARLYLDALDIMPFDDENVKEDEFGHIYRLPSEKAFMLYESNANYDALRVDVFKISVLCQGTWYYGTFQILPKPMSSQEWVMMKADLEVEIKGLAQDIVRRNIGIGQFKNGDIPPKALYDFFIIRRYSKNVLTALVDIAENPRYEIITQYETISSNSNCAFDSETVKRYVMRAGAEPTFKVPVKVICYDIQDNKLLKMIILEYEKRINRFLDLLGTVDKYSMAFSSGGSIQYRNVWRDSVTEFKETAIKLRKMTSILKTKDWYFQIADVFQPYVPHSFVLDTRYNTLYQMYLALKKEEMQVDLDPEFAYTWKRSSYLYEMWCYFKVCRILTLNFDAATTDWNFIFSDKVLFPFLEAGTKITFEDQDIRLEVIFDSPLPTNKLETSEKNPLFIAKHHDNIRTHNRPDIVVNVYDKCSAWYLGTIILECKYRKLNSFWSNNSKRSSRGQLEAYYNNARSKYLYGTLGEMLKSNPVKKVIVLTPDIYGDGREQRDFNILVKGFKPALTDNMVDSLQKELLREIQEMKSISARLHTMK
ncbi:MAG: hypothetical protein LBS02_12815 [Hungatella sp.]|jgi:hypothetical protein|nr:hypothetical protein [Hungatella sp.]